MPKIKRFDVDALRQDFPALQQQHQGKPVIFFDGPGGSQVAYRTIQAMQDYLGRYNSNLGGAFFSSHLTTDLMNKARYYAANLLNAELPENIVFGANMSSLTFSFSRTLAKDWQAGDEIIVTRLDHYANVSSWQQAAKDKGCLVHQIDVNPNTCDLDYSQLEALISEKTRLIALTYASNTTGTIVDVKRVVDKAYEVGAQVFVDAVHYAPHHLIDVQSLRCDFLVCSAYKFFGPHIGMMYVHPQWLHRLEPYKVEPATNIGPGRYETGTQNFEALSGMVACIEHLAALGDPEASLRLRLKQSFEYYSDYEQQLSLQFLQQLTQFPEVTCYGHTNLNAIAKRTPTFALKMKGIDSGELAKYLAEQNICVWSGHFYAVGLLEQLQCEEHGGFLRVGLMHYNTQQEIETFFKALRLGIEALSP
ncbi:cysteine desulfurase-like protein [Vibrio rumoiensis]|uniref:cysteine desulfurase-like protein n=1 Tax=Vibrio rumoiensis TaxID=76258 RepID=UPI000B5CB865|nr:cysteine desulfurase-like protein [Vibrio rumoiensis]